MSVATKDVAENRYRAPALDKGLDILELLAEQPLGLTRAEIVRAMGRSQSEIYRMLERLVVRDYVFRSAEGDRYALTMKLFVLGSKHPPVRRMVARALPLMDAFARTTHQSVHLVVPDRGDAVVMAQTSSPANWEFRVRVGAQLDLLTTGSGETLVAFQDDEGRRELLETWGKARDAAQVKAIEPILIALRKNGHRIGDSRQLAGVRDISVPIFGPKGHAVAVLTCPYLQRLDTDTDATIDETLVQLKELARTLSLD